MRTHEVTSIDRRQGHPGSYAISTTPTVVKVNSCQELDAGQLRLASSRTVSRRLRESRTRGFARRRGRRDGTARRCPGRHSAGHIEPTIDFADALRRLEPTAEITAPGTVCGLDITLILARGNSFRRCRRGAN
jgi:hypothetical protein